MRRRGRAQGRPADGAERVARSQPARPAGPPSRPAQPARPAGPPSRPAQPARSILPAVTRRRRRRRPMRAAGASAGSGVRQPRPSCAGRRRRPGRRSGARASRPRAAPSAAGASGRLSPKRASIAGQAGRGPSGSWAASGGAGRSRRPRPRSVPIRSARVWSLTRGSASPRRRGRPGWRRPRSGSAQPSRVSGARATIRERASAGPAARAEGRVGGRRPRAHPRLSRADVVENAALGCLGPPDRRTAARMARLQEVSEPTIGRMAPPPEPAASRRGRPPERAHREATPQGCTGAVAGRLLVVNGPGRSRVRLAADTGRGGRAFALALGTTGRTGPALRAAIGLGALLALRLGSVPTPVPPTPVSEMAHRLRRRAPPVAPVPEGVAALGPGAALRAPVPRPARGGARAGRGGRGRSTSRWRGGWPSPSRGLARRGVAASLDAPVGERGVTLSGGRRQRPTIARR